MITALSSEQALESWPIIERFFLELLGGEELNQLLFSVSQKKSYIWLYSDEKEIRAVFATSVAPIGGKLVLELNWIAGKLGRVGRDEVDAALKSAQSWWKADRTEATTKRKVSRQLVKRGGKQDNNLWQRST